MSWKLHLKLKSALEATGHGSHHHPDRPRQATWGWRPGGKKPPPAATCSSSLHSNACGTVHLVDAPLACCTVTGTMDVLGQQLANVVHQVMGTAQAGTIWKREGDNGDYYGVLRGGNFCGNTGDLAGAQLPHQFAGDQLAAVRCQPAKNGRG